VESKLIPCERCGAGVALLIFAPGATDLRRFEDYGDRESRSSYQKILIIVPILLNTLYSGLLGGLIVELIVQLVGLPAVGLSYGLLVGLIVAQYNGGHTCLQHVLIRGLLTRNGSAPWRYAAFLDYAAERILLRKVGGGYMFIHRYLLDYFARLESVGPTQAATSIISDSQTS